MKNIKYIIITLMVILTFLPATAQAGRSFIESKGGVDLYLEEVGSVVGKNPGSKIILKNNNRYPAKIVISRKELKNPKSFLNGKTVITVNGGKEGSDNINYFGPIEVRIIAVEGL